MFELIRGWWAACVCLGSISNVGPVPLPQTITTPTPTRDVDITRDGLDSSELALIKKGTDNKDPEVVQTRDRTDVRELRQVLSKDDTQFMERLPEQVSKTGEQLSTANFGRLQGLLERMSTRLGGDADQEFIGLMQQKLEGGGTLEKPELERLSRMVSSAQDNPMSHDSDGLPDGLEGPMGRSMKQALGESPEARESTRELLGKLRDGKPLTGDDKEKLKELLEASVEGLRGQDARALSELAAHLDSAVDGTLSPAMRESLGNVLEGALSNPLAGDIDGLPDGLEGAIGKELKKLTSENPEARELLRTVLEKMANGTELTDQERGDFKKLLKEAAGNLDGVSELKQAALASQLGRIVDDLQNQPGNVLGALLEAVANPLSGDSDGLPDGLEGALKREIASALGAQRDDDVQFLQDMKALIGRDKSPTVSQLERLKALVPEASVIETEPLEDVTPFDQGAYDGAVRRLGESHSAGSPDYEVFGPMPKGKAKELLDKLQELPPESGIRGSFQQDERGNIFLVVHNVEMGNLRSFDIDRGYDEHLPPPPPPHTTQPLNPSDSSHHPDVSLSISSSLSLPLSSELSGDDAIVQEEEGPVSTGRRVELRWTEPEETDMGLTEVIQEPEITPTREVPEQEREAYGRIEAFLKSSETTAGLKQFRGDMNTISPESAGHLLAQYQDSSHGPMLAMLRQRASGATFTVPLPTTTPTPPETKAPEDVVTTYESTRPGAGTVHASANFLGAIGEGLGQIAMAISDGGMLRGTDPNKKDPKINDYMGLTSDGGGRRVLAEGTEAQVNRQVRREKGIEFKGIDRTEEPEETEEQKAKKEKELAAKQRIKDFFAGDGQSTGLQHYRQTLNDMSPESARSLLEEFKGKIDEQPVMITMLRQRASGATFTVARPVEQQPLPEDNKPTIMSEITGFDRSRLKHVQAPERDMEKIREQVRSEALHRELSELGATRPPEAEILMQAMDKIKLPEDTRLETARTSSDVGELTRLATSDDQDIQRAVYNNEHTPPDVKQKIEEEFAEWDLTL